MKASYISALYPAAKDAADATARRDLVHFCMNVLEDRRDTIQSRLLISQSLFLNQT